MRKSVRYVFSYQKCVTIINTTFNSVKLQQLQHNLQTAMTNMQADGQAEVDGQARQADG